MQSNPFTETPNFPSSPGSSRSRAMDANWPAPDEREGVVADDAGEFWFWATNDGALKTVDRRELENSLRKGEIPTTALVWKAGWGEWLRAAEVKELGPSISPSARLSPAAPKMSPDATHPPPIPKGNGHLAPIVPVASTPANDKPVTQLLVEAELGADELEPVKIVPPPRPKSSAPPAPNRAKAAPIIPAKSTAKNDKPETIDVPVDEIDVEVEAEAPPSANWKEVAAPRAAHKPDPAPIVPAKSSPKNDPPTGEIDAGEIEFVEEKKATLSDLEASIPAKAQAPAPAGFKSTVLGMPAAPQAAKAPAAAPAAKAEKAPTPIGKSTMLGMPAAPPAGASPQPVAPAVATAAPKITEREASTQLRDAIVPVSDPENEAPTIVKESPLNADQPAPLPSWSEEVDAQIAQPEAALPAPTPPPPAAARQSYESITPPKKSSMGLLLGGIGMVVILGGATVAAGLAYLKPWDTTEQDAAKTAAAPPTESAAPAEPDLSTVACKVTKKGKEISGSAYLGVPPYVAVSGDKVAIGFAAKKTNAIGVSVNATSLASTEVMTRASTSAITSVVPVFEGDKPSFIVDSAGTLKRAHTVVAKERFVIGLGPKGFRLHRGNRCAEDHLALRTHEHHHPARRERRGHGPRGHLPQRWPNR